MTAPDHSFFLPCPRGLEQALADEITELGAGSVRVGRSGVHCSGGWALAAKLNVWSRIASRVLWRVGQCTYAHEQDVYRGACRLPWGDWFTAQETLRVDVSAIDAPLKSLSFITLKVKDAICDTLRAQGGARPNIDTRQPDVRVWVFLEAERATFYLDTSGEPLFKRGWRQEGVDAPLRENLAAGILRLTGWDRQLPLFDPMCGGGTFLIEGARWALGLPPALPRTYALQKLRGTDATLFPAARQAVPQGSAPHHGGFFGADQAPRAIAQAQAHTLAAGLAEHIRYEVASLPETRAPDHPGVLVSNPPYGVRLSETEALQAFYPVLGDWLKHACSGWNAWLLTADLTLPKHIRLQPKRKIPLFNGNLECRLYQFPMVAGRPQRHSTPSAD